MLPEGFEVRKKSTNVAGDVVCVVFRNTKATNSTQRWSVLTSEYSATFGGEIERRFRVAN